MQLSKMRMMISCRENAFLFPFNSKAYSFILVLLVSALRAVSAQSEGACFTSAKEQSSLATDFAYPKSYNFPPRQSSQPLNIGQLKDQLKAYYRCAYRQDVRLVLNAAWTYVDQRAPQVTNPAIVLDIDETSLSNWMEIWQDDFAYIADGPCDMKPGFACGRRAWELSAQASAIEPTLDFFNKAQERNIPIFFITGRPDTPEERSATVDNLAKVGYAGWKELIMRKPEMGRTVTEYKTGARAAISKQGYTIIANVGDQWSDLDKDPDNPERGAYSERIFKVPNPYYFIP